MDMRRIVAFDADDTLWTNEINFRRTEVEFAALLGDYLPAREAVDQLFKTELKNLPLYGYGVKGFTLSMLETAIRVSKGSAPAGLISRVIELGKELLSIPVELLDGVSEVIDRLSRRYTLVMATKGDLHHQERKLAQSGLADYFHHIEIMSDKKEANYLKLLKHLEIDPQRFTMVGNSVRSDIEPVLSLGGHAIHVPCHTTWQYEQAAGPVNHDRRFHEVEHIGKVLEIL